jgi:hypothetical protein
MGVLDWIKEHPYATAAVAVGGATLLVTGTASATQGPTTPAPPAPGGGGGDGAAGPLASSARAIRPPSAYGADYRATMVGRWNGTLGAEVRRQGAIVWPGVPPEVFMGFSAGSGQRDNTAITANNNFAELGFFGTEGGAKTSPPNAGPYPSPTPGPNNSWQRWANDALTVRALGRPAPMDNNAWQADIAAQVAIGLVNLRKRLDEVNALLPAAARAAVPPASSLYAVALSFAAWSAGIGGVARQLGAYGAELAAAPEGERLGAWVRAVLAGVRNNTVRGSGHANPAYTLTRTLQKLNAGKVLADAANAPAATRAWFAPAVLTAAEESLLNRGASTR